MAAKSKTPTFSVDNLTPDDLDALRRQFPQLERHGRPEPLPPGATKHGEAAVFKMVIEMVPEMLGLASAILAFVTALKQSQMANEPKVDRAPQPRSAATTTKTKKKGAKRARR